MSNIVKLHLTKKEVEKLVKGLHVSYNHAKQLKKKTAKSHSIFLTKVQKEKHAHHLRTGHAYKLKFSKKQIHHHLQHGGGFFDNIANFFKKTLPNTFTKTIPNGVKSVISSIKDPAFQNGFKKGFRMAFGPGSDVANLLVPQTKPVTDIIRKVTGSGMRKRRAGSLVKMGHRYGSSLVKF